MEPGCWRAINLSAALLFHRLYYTARAVQHWMESNELAEDWYRRNDGKMKMERQQTRPLCLKKHAPLEVSEWKMCDSPTTKISQTEIMCVFTYAGLSSSISAVVESGSKSRFFLTLCLGDVGLPGPALPLFVSYSWQQQQQQMCGVLITTALQGNQPHYKGHSWPLNWSCG